jgi:hypothetical protein
MLRSLLNFICMKLQSPRYNSHEYNSKQKFNEEKRMNQDLGITLVSRINELE